MACVLLAAPLRGPAQSQASGTVLASSAQQVDSALDQSYRSMYNLQFDEALRQTESAKALDRNDPIPWMAQACAILFREFDRMHILRSELFSNDNAFIDGPAIPWNAQNRAAFDAALVGAEKLAQQRLQRDKNDSRGLFALTLVTGLRADDAALIGKKKFSALSYTKSANGYAERLLAVSPDFYDAYLATGMGKYIIGRKSAPVRWVLRMGGYKGDEQEGIKELALAADRARYLAPFARILVAFEDVRKNNTAEARRKLEQLHQQFPDNHLFVEEINKLGRTSAQLTHKDNSTHQGD